MAKAPWRALLLGLSLLLSACGGGGGGSTGGGTTTNYTVGGTLSGLASGQSVTLNNKSTGESLTLKASGNFAFTTTQATGANYAVTVSAQPTGQSCFVTDGLGVVGSANVTSVMVACTTPHTVGGSVSGLASGQTVTLIDNSRDTKPVAGTAGGGSVSFTFGTTLSGGQTYNVQIASQPVGAVCQVTSGGSGIVSTTNGVNVANVVVTCSATPSPEYVYVATTNGSNGVQPYSINLSNGALTNVGLLFNTDATPVALAADSVGQYLYTVGAGSNDVTRLTRDTGTGGITAGTSVAAGTDPYGVAVSSNGKFVYVANSNDNTISIYSSSSGGLQPIVGTPVVSSGGVNPQGIVFNPSGSYLYVLNFGSNTVTTFAADPNTGALTAVGSPVPTGVNPYGVQASVTPGGSFLYVANYGSNSISAYSLGSNGLPSPIAGSPFAAGANPFAVAVNPAGTFAYVANESDGTVSVYSIDPTYGTLTPVVGSPVPVGAGTKPESVAVDPSGQFLYVSNNQYSGGTVVEFDISQSAGTLSGATNAASGLAGPRPLVAVRP